MGHSGTAAVVIPARLGSRRFPRKVLVRETGKYLVQHVWEAVVGCPGISRVIIATDSDEVEEAVRSFGGEARMTSPDHVSGTDRVAEVARELSEELIINVQGDEPHITHADLEVLIGLFDEGRTREAAGATGPGDSGRVEMTTLAVRRTDLEGFHDPHVVKVVMGNGGRALYFSRAPIPYATSGEESGAELEWWQHLGVYGYRREFLLRLASLAPTALEKRERLEQLRVLGNGYVIRVGRASGRHLGIDTPEEYREFVREVGER